MRKAQFLELDALFAIAILIGGLLFLKGLYIHPYEAPQIENTANDAVTTLQTRTMSSLGASYLSQLQTRLTSTGVTIRENETIARQLTMLLITAEEGGVNSNALFEAAENLSRTAMQGIIRPGEHYNITLLSADRRYTLASSNEPATIATQARTMLSGLQVDRSIYGFTASAYLSDANSRQASYYHFGGFVGQGNITATLDIPETPIAFTLEGDFHDNFTLSVNSNTPCTTITIPITTDPFTSITQEDLTADCLAQLHIGKNTIFINFTGDDLDRQYIGGGYLKATYLSDKTYTLPSVVTKNHTMPGIEGVFNLYDAIYIPGELQSMNVRLHYYSNHTENNNTVFFSIGNATLHEDNASIHPQIVTISDAQIRANLSVNGITYADLTNKTVPFRMGYKNVTKEFISGNIIDTALITDLSGSMDAAMGAGTRLDLAKIVDKDFVHIILNSSENNHIGLVSYGYEVINYTALSNNESYLNATIDNYQTSGYTCTGCGIKKAMELVAAAPEDHYRAILVMSDGEANWCYDDPDNATYCQGVSSHHSYWRPTSCDCSDTIAVQQAINYANMTRQQGIEVYAVAFTTAGSNNMRRIARVNEPYDPLWNETYYHVGNNVSELRRIYNEIAQRIVSLGQYDAQIVSLSTNNNSILFPDSYIEYTYTPHPLPELYGKLLINGERRPFSTSRPCEATGLNFSLALSPVEGNILSYSGNHWTDYLSVNNNELYNLTAYDNNYQSLGDPFVIGIPPGVMSRGPNVFSLRTANSPTQPTGCSPHNKLLYTATLDNTLSLSAVYPEAEGCLWTVNMLGSETTLPLPQTYTESNECTYVPGTINYDTNDAWQALGYELFRLFDIDFDGSVDINFTEQNLDLNLQQQEDIPYLWGPALLEVVVWR